MICSYHYCSLASYVLKTVSHQSQKSYITIKPEDAYLQKKLKGFGMYAEKTFYTVALAVAYLSIPLFILMEVGVNFLEKIGLNVVQLYDKDFYFGFKSRVYDAFYQQLQNFVTSHPNKDILLHPSTAFQAETKKLIELILESPQLENEEKKREFHQKLMAGLRPLVALKQEDSQHVSARFIEELCEWLYNGPRIIDQMATFIEEELTTEEMDRMINSPLAELSDHLQTVYDGLSNKPKFNGINESSRLYDPHALGDVPSLLYHYKLQNGQKVKILRTPVVTKDVERDKRGNLVRAEIVEEFIGFLDSYGRQAKVHVYFNLMQKTGSEGVRSKLVEELESRYPNTLHVISLSKDSNFYWQKGNYFHFDSAAAFKQEFMVEMFERNENYHWSPILGLPWKDECNQLLNDIHQNHFDGKEQLSHQERLDFIEYTYDEIKKSVLNKIKPHSANDSCKSCVDRGAADLAEQYMTYQYVKNNSTLSSSKRKKMMAIALAPALLAMNRSMQNQRMKRLCSFAKHCFS